MLTSYPDCDLTRPALPPRSRLYHLEPLGVGTPLVEGVTSYVIRLAAAHAVPPILLIRHEVLPALYPEPGHHPAATRLGYLWGAYGNVLNGLRDGTTRWRTVLADLTGQASLTAGTLLHWRDVLAAPRLLRRTHAWCPYCYAEWDAAGQPRYDPLLWSIAVVTVCPQHETALQEHCPACGATIPCLHRQAYPGRCPHCATWLMPVSRPAVRVRDRWATWVARQVGALLAAPLTHPPPARTHVAAVVQAMLNQVPTWKPMTILARQLGVRTTTVLTWHTGTAVPELDNWLRLAAVGGTSLHAILTCVPPPLLADDYPPLPGRPSSQRRAPPRRTLDHAAVAAYLTQVLTEPSDPPPSMRAVGRQLGYADSYLRQYFPDLCRAISAQYLASCRARYMARRQQVDADIRAAVVTLHAQGRYPKLTDVAALVRDPGTIRDPLARKVWRTEVERLGWWRSTADESPDALQA